MEGEGQGGEPTDSLWELWVWVFVQLRPKLGIVYLSKGICYGINCRGIARLLSVSGDGLNDQNVGVSLGARSVNNSAGTGIRGQ